MKKNIFLYNINGIKYFLYPKFLGKYAIKSKLSAISKLNDYELEKISKRVNYYCCFIPTSVPKIPNLSNFELLKKGSRYFFDTYEHMRFFPKHLLYTLEQGDINFELSTPSLCKSRPVLKDFSNNILLNMDKIRHFKFFTSLPLIKYESKKDILFFRGACYQNHRKDFMRKYFNHSICDLGHVGKEDEEELKIWKKEKISIENHMQYKFILSLEGNDVATNLKWIMSSNSLAVMPEPKFETWFMEGRLIPNMHYIKIKSNYENLQDRLEYYISHPNESKEIIQNANSYIKQFLDKKTENLISFLVLRKYFYQTHQIEISSIEKQIFK
ncbi:glycosyl transferase family 90 [Helicobacter cappadocius]|uniref:Glycosyl transferase family 90 n=1 Tax=Helicobacter cappadocius TaxID=3063998 RepID=A0AA90TFC5_9HELI|nr:MULTISPECIES: glycosyl transferase family 90 [unclassified Helicobacter]MDO7253567.1 glycosyl transferase family 90 [Helicobacter sp. faydin-H75]MDP2539495.1 glycosyl transferase family 90 [Helicobacter sp. faydin-H76]